MRTVNELLDQVKAEKGIPSDYKLAMYLGVSQGTVQNWRHQRSLPDQLATSKIAKELGLDADVLILEIEAQRAPSELARSNWLRIAERLQAGVAHAGVLVAVGAIALASHAPNAVAAVTHLGTVAERGVCILCSIACALRGRGSRAFSGLRGGITSASLGRFVRSTDVQSAHAAAAGFAAA